MFRLCCLMMVLALAAMACAVDSDSGGASEPVASALNPTSEAGASAVSSSAIDPDTCVGVLVPVTGELSMNTQSLTSAASASQPNLESMCSAMYDTGVPGEKFLAVALIKFKSNASAVDHYELMKSAFVASGVGISELNNASEELTDQISALIDSDGIGRTTVLRRGVWVLSVSAGPTMAVSPWTVGDLEMIGKNVLDRVN